MAGAPVICPALSAVNILGPCDIQHDNDRAVPERYENAVRESKRVSFNSYTGDALAQLQGKRTKNLLPYTTLSTSELGVGVLRC